MLCSKGEVRQQPKPDRVSVGWKLGIRRKEQASDFKKVLQLNDTCYRQDTSRESRDVLLNKGK